MSATAQPQLPLTAPTGSDVELILDGMTLRDGGGQEIATLTAAGWITPEGIPTERVRVPIGAPHAVIDTVALARQRQAEDDVWLEQAIRQLHALARERPTLTVDDAWELITMPPRDPRNQMSRLMRAGQRERLIALTGDTVACTRNNGGRRVRVWRSLIHEGEHGDERAC
jgi:hypothetical protein